MAATGLYIYCNLERHSNTFCRGMNYLHEHKPEAIIHRDLEPSYVFFLKTFLWCFCYTILISAVMKVFGPKYAILRSYWLDLFESFSFMSKITEIYCGMILGIWKLQTLESASFSKLQKQSGKTVLVKTLLVSFLLLGETFPLVVIC